MTPANIGCVGGDSIPEGVGLPERLERGELVVFAKCPFPLPVGDDREFLIAQTVADGVKSISWYPDEDRLHGHLRRRPGDGERVAGLLRSFNRAADDWLGRALPRFRAAARNGPLRFRTEEEEGRDYESRYSGSVLHVDMSGDAPAHGESFLRIFVNINPSQPREWITSDSLGELLDRWGDRIREAGEGPPGLRERIRLRLGRLLGFPPPADSPYHRLMSRAHFFGKTDDHLQSGAPRRKWVFPPSSAWLVFSDLVNHAVVRGRFAIDKTYIVAPTAFADRRRSTAAIIERFWAGRPAAP